MTIDKISYGNPAEWHGLRGKDVTASIVAALFNEHPFQTYYGLWLSKAGKMPRRDDEESAAMQRGRLLEPVAVNLLRERFPHWEITHNAQGGFYFRDSEARLGATPDVIVEDPENGRGVIQIKSVERSIYKANWFNLDGDLEPPLWIALQASVEAYLTGAKWAAVAPLIVGHGLDLPLIDIPPVNGLIDHIKAKTAEFWKSIEEGREPKPDFANDGETINRLYANVTPDKVLDLRTNNRIGALISAVEAASAHAKVIEAEIEEAKAEIKSIIGDAEVALLPDGRKITWKMQDRKSYVVEAKSFRVLRMPTVKK